MMYEATLRLSVFIGVLAVMTLWEWLAPRRVPKISRALRWRNNLGLVVLNTLLLRVLFPTATVGIALWAHSHHIGLFNLIDLPYWLVIVMAVLILDLAIYAQHVAFHYVPILWRLHRVHHADMDIDVTTGLRFHPIEIIVSLLIKFAVVVLIGAPVLAVILFEVILNATAMFNHGNVRLAQRLDRVLRKVIVTPDMHRVHHSVVVKETNSNFGFNLSIWDRIFKTYRAQPKAGHIGMDIGLTQYREPKQSQGLWGMLMIPFKGK